MGEEDLKTRVRNAKPQFKPVPVYYQDGDRIDFYWENEPAGSQNVNHDAKCVGNIHSTFGDDGTDPRIVGISIHMEALRATSFAKLAANIIERMTDKERKQLREELEGTMCFHCFRKLKPENGEDCRCTEEP